MPSWQRQPVEYSPLLEILPVYDSVAVVGATGAVGTIILKLLESRRFPFRSIKFLASKRSAGKTITFCGRPYTVEELRSSLSTNFQIDRLQGARR